MELERDDHPVPFDPFLMKGGSPGKWDLILLFIPDDGGGNKQIHRGVSHTLKIFLCDSIFNFMTSKKVKEQLEQWNLDGIL